MQTPTKKTWPLFTFKATHILEYNIWGTKALLALLTLRHWSAIVDDHRPARVPRTNGQLAGAMDVFVSAFDLFSSYGSKFRIFKKNKKKNS